MPRQLGVLYGETCLVVTSPFCICRWDFLPIEFEVPAKLAQRVMPWITMGHKHLAAPGQRLLFVLPSSGTGMSNVNLSHWWTQLLASHSAPFRMQARELRHVFVDERCGSNAVEGPDGRAAARVMGNRSVSTQ